MLFLEETTLYPLGKRNISVAVNKAAACSAYLRHTSNAFFSVAMSFTIVCVDSFTVQFTCHIYNPSASVISLGMSV